MKILLQNAFWLVIVGFFFARIPCVHFYLADGEMQ